MKNIISLVCICFLFGCTENVDLETRTLVKVGSETIFYSAYNTGIDNYRIEVKAQKGQDTEVLLTTYINDAGFYPNTLTATVKGDTVFIISRPPVELKSSRTKSGVLVIMVRPRL